MTPDVREQVEVIPPEQRTCTWCAEHHPVTLDPIGPECGRPATHVLEWTWPAGGPGSRKWSFACQPHSEPPGIDPSGTHGWIFTTHELESRP